MIVRDVTISEIRTAVEPLGFTVKRLNRTYSYRFSPTTSRYRLLSATSKPSNEPCLHGYVAIVKALRAVRPKARPPVPEAGETLAYRALSAVAAGVEVPENLSAGGLICACVEGA